MKKKKSEEFDYQSFEQEAISKLRSGKGLTGEGWTPGQVLSCM